MRVERPTLADRTGERWQISNGGGRQPLWREDGRELYFVNDADRKFYAVAVRSSSTFMYGTPKFLFEMRANLINTRNSCVPEGANLDDPQYREDYAGIFRLDQ